MNKIGFLGSGNMAEALIKGLINSGLFKPENILIADIRPERLESLSSQYGVTQAKNNADLAKKAGTIVLAVKPQKMTDALESIKAQIREGQLIISIAAGIKISKIERTLGDVPIIRVMPNTPALVGEGASALFANKKATFLLDMAKSIFQSVGIAVTVDCEDLIDTVTAVSGSGPAYFFLLMEKMIKAAVELGLPGDIATTLVLKTARGAAILAENAAKNDETCEQLRIKVTSPGGTTEAALETFDQGSFDKLAVSAVKAAYKRSKELSE